MMCVSPIIFALSIAISGDVAVFYEWGALRRAETHVSVWHWRGEVLCTRAGWVT